MYVCDFIAVPRFTETMKTVGQVTNDQSGKKRSSDVIFKSTAVPQLEETVENTGQLASV
jgi:hypothetical protein